MKAFSFLKNDQFSIGVETPDGIFNLTYAFDVFQKAKRVPQPVSFAFIQVMVEMGYFTAQAIHRILNDSWVCSKIESIRIKEPIQYDLPIARPSKIIAIGRNYAAHAKELDNQVSKEPTFFCKASSTLIPHQANIEIPEWLDTRVDHEAELGVIIGKIGKNITEDQAMEHVAGYTIINDVTARAIQKQDIENGDPWFRSKSIDTFCPIGPYLVPVDAIEDPLSLNILCKVNGEIRQKSNTKNMLFNIPKIIANVSQYMTLNAGDIIATGTPEGVGPIKDGDEVEITIQHLGTLKNKVIGEINR